MNNIFSQPTDHDALTLAHAIALQESGQNGHPNYNASGDAGTSHGAYQWQPGNFEAAAKEAGLDPSDFSPANQDKVAYYQVKKDKDAGLDPGQIASKWNSGSPNNWQNHSGTTTINGQQIHYDTPAYVRGVQEHYKNLLGSSGGQVGGQPQVTQAANTPHGYGYVQPPAPASDNNATQDFGGENTLQAPQGLVGSILGSIGNFAKSATAPVATMLARPVQAGAELLGATDQQVNEASSKVPIYGANGALNVPENLGDVKKDVGRGAETVAYGLGPVAGGALFGGGNSVEQGNNILSGQTALQAGLGAAAGGAIQLAAPLIGKAASAVTPKIVKQAGGAIGDALAPAAGAVSDFAANTKILPDFASSAINKGAEAIDAIPGKIGAGIANQYGFGAGATRQDALEAVDKALGETGKKSAGVFANAADNKLTGLENMAANADKVKLADGAVYDPTTADLHQQVEALAQLKQDAYKTWMASVHDATGAGVTVDTDPVVSELTSYAASPGNVRGAAYAKRVASEIEALKGNPLELQNYLQTLNSGLRGVFSGGTASIERDVDAQAVKSLNNALDSSVMDVESGAQPIREAKNLYSSYKSVEDGLVKKAQMAARRAEGGMGGGLYDYVNPFNIADALDFFSNPVGAAKGALRIGLLAKAKAAKNPEQILQGVFKTIQNYKGVTPAEELFHGANASTAQKIQEGGFIGSQDFPGNGMVSLTPDKAEAARYAALGGEGKGNVLPVEVKGSNIRTYPSMEDYIANIERQGGKTAAENEAAMNAGYDMVRIKIPGQPDVIFANPQSAGIKAPKASKGLVGGALKVGAAGGLVKTTFPNTASQ